jgi:SEC-C motif-containing protein
MELCPCGSGSSYTTCCEPFHSGVAIAPTAEALMRSRYAAYVKVIIPYILQTTAPEARKTLDEKATQSWAEDTDWRGLEIMRTEKGSATDSEGVVEFAAHFKENNERRKHHEIAVFKKIEDKWYYDDGKLPTPNQVQREQPKVGRNENCPCGSGKKYKKCCALAA